MDKKEKYLIYLAILAGTVLYLYLVFFLPLGITSPSTFNRPITTSPIFIITIIVDIVLFALLFLYRKYIRTYIIIIIIIFIISITLSIISSFIIADGFKRGFA